MTFFGSSDCMGVMQTEWWNPDLLEQWKEFYATLITLSGLPEPYSMDKL